MIKSQNKTKAIHSSWQEILSKAYDSLDQEYRDFLEKDKSYFPNKDNYLNVFKTLSKNQTRFILFGQDPYPRKESASGYAFIDEKVKTLFNDKGFSKEVNKATSLRNFMKMILLANGFLNQDDISQNAISKIEKSLLIDSVKDLRLNFEREGVLLLNAALIFTDKKDSLEHVKAWQPFVQSLLRDLEESQIKLILFGTQAKELKKKLDLEKFKIIEMEHPYNASFVLNKKALKLFATMNLLEK